VEESSYHTSAQERKQTDVANYRPISNLCSLGKLYEKCLLEKITGFAKRHIINLFGENQHAYRKNHSTATACLTLQSMISNQLDRCKNCLVYSVDLSAAFDLLRPDIMERTLSNFPLELRRPIMDFLRGREFVVEYNGSYSHIKKIKVGCVQPCLFSIYCRELQSLLKTEKVNLVTNADDTYVFICGDTNEELVATAEKTMVTHFGFLEKIGMVVNKSKTEATLFGKEKTCLELTVDNSKITTESSMKVLGLIFNHDLCYERLGGRQDFINDI